MIVYQNKASNLLTMLSATKLCKDHILTRHLHRVVIQHANGSAHCCDHLSMWIQIHMGHLHKLAKKLQFCISLRFKKNSLCTPTCKWSMLCCQSSFLIVLCNVDFACFVTKRWHPQVLFQPSERTIPICHHPHLARLFLFLWRQVLQQLLDTI